MFSFIIKAELETESYEDDRSFLKYYKNNKYRIRNEHLKVCNFIYNCN